MSMERNGETRNTHNAEYTRDRTPARRRWDDDARPLDERTKKNATLLTSMSEPTRDAISTTSNPLHTSPMASAVVLPFSRVIQLNTRTIEFSWEGGSGGGREGGRVAVECVGRYQLAFRRINSCRFHHIFRPLSHIPKRGNDNEG
jgi:hypothetical protein